MPTRNGSFRLFRLAGIDVYVHWLWILFAVLRLSGQIGGFLGDYSSPIWKVAEYLSLFLIVLMHEFGHALACRSVGGEANQIILWFLGGVAYVSPPQRPGAMLWSIVAGPLVNVMLVPIFTILTLIGDSAGWETSMPNLFIFIRVINVINYVL